MNDDDTLARSHRAAAEYRQTEQAFADLRGAILEKLVGTPPAQTDLILKLHMAAQNLSAVQLALMQMVQHGQVAARAMELAGLTSPH